MKLIDSMKSVWRKVNQLNSHLSNECSKAKSFCYPTGGIIISGVKSVIKFIALVFFNMWKTSSAYPLDGFYMIWKIGAKNFETDYDSYILHWEFKLRVGDGNCQIAPT